MASIYAHARTGHCACVCTCKCMQACMYVLGSRHNRLCALQRGSEGGDGKMLRELDALRQRKESARPRTPGVQEQVRGVPRILCKYARCRRTVWVV